MIESSKQRRDHNAEFEMAKSEFTHVNDYAPSQSIFVY